MTEKWTSSEATRDEMRAADEPRPVLCTSPMGMPVYAKGSILDSEDMTAGKPSSASYECIGSFRQHGLTEGRREYTDLSTLGIKIIVA